MFELMYASRAVVDLNEREMEALLGVSRSRNQEAGLTGMLLHLHDVPAHQAFFVQILEGAQDAVEQTFRRIAIDELHADVTVVHRGMAERHSFQDWQMGLATMDISVADELAQDHMPTQQPTQPAKPVAPALPARSRLALLSNAFLARTMLRLGAQELRQHGRSETAGIMEHVDRQVSPTTRAFFWRDPDGQPLAGQ